MRDMSTLLLTIFVVTGACSNETIVRLDDNAHGGTLVSLDVNVFGPDHKPRRVASLKENSSLRLEPGESIFVNSREISADKPDGLTITFKDGTLRVKRGL